MKYIQLICGPAGSGKTTYVTSLSNLTLQGSARRTVYCVNLDPGCDSYTYDAAFDVRELVGVEDVMEELEMGPNGATIYCHEYLLENVDWLQDKLEEFPEDAYIVLDCCGQIELYTHLDVMQRLVSSLTSFGCSVVALFLVDATFVADAGKFISGSLLSLSCMLKLELPHVNVLTKCDLLPEGEVDRILDMKSASAVELPSRNPVLNGLTRALQEIIDDFSQVAFLPLNLKEEGSLELVLEHADHALQWGEGRDVEVNEDLFGEGGEEG